MDVARSSGGTPIAAGTVDVGVEVGSLLDVSNGLSLGGKVGITPQQALGIPVGGLPTLTMSVQTPLEANWVVPIRPGQIVAVSLDKKTMPPARPGASAPYPTPEPTPARLHPTSKEIPMLLDVLHFVVQTPSTSLLDALIQSIQWVTGSSTQSA